MSPREKAGGGGDSEEGCVARSGLWVGLRVTEDASIQDRDGGYAQPRTKPDFPSSRSDVPGMQSVHWVSNKRPQHRASAFKASGFR